MSEANTLIRLYVCAALPMIENSSIDAINSLQRHTILRTWSAKLFEFMKFIEKLNAESRKSTEPLASIVTPLMMASRSLRSGAGYSIVREVRNSAANHYLLDRALENLEHLSDKADLRLLMHEIEGNSTSPIGEEVMFAGALNRMRENSDMNLYEEWHSWNMEASRWLRQCHLDLWKNTVFARFPRKFANKRAHWLPDAFVGEIDVDFAPLFLRRN